MGCGSSTPAAAELPAAAPDAAKKIAEAAEEARKKKEADEKIELERIAAEKERIVKEEAEKAQNAQAEVQRLAKVEADRLAAAEEAEKKRLAKVEADRLAAEKAEKDRLAALKAKHAPFQQFVGPNEVIVMSNLFDKMSGGVMVGFQPRRLILTKKPKLSSVDMASKEVKGNIDWSADFQPTCKVEADKHSIMILAKTPDNGERSYVFKHHAEDANADLNAWTTAINQFKK